MAISPGHPGYDAFVEKTAILADLGARAGTNGRIQLSEPLDPADTNITAQGDPYPS